MRKYEPLIAGEDEQLNKLVKTAAYICQTPISLVNLIEANHTIFKAAVGTNLKGSPREISFCSKAIENGGIMEITDATQDDRFKNNPLVTGDLHVRFYAGATLVNKDGMNMGTICVFDQKPKVLLPEQKEALALLGEMAVLVLESKKLSQTLLKANLSAVLSLEKKVDDIQTKLQFCRKFLPSNVGDEILGSQDSFESTVEEKEMVLLNCTLQTNAFAGAVSINENIALLARFYKSMNHIFSVYHGTVYQIDGFTIKGMFSEPFATFPFEENALYCAFEMIAEGEKLYDAISNKNTAITLSIELHCGDVYSGNIYTGNSIEYVVWGQVADEMKLITVQPKQSKNTVRVSDAFFNKIKEKVQVQNKNTVVINNGKEFTLYEVSP